MPGDVPELKVIGTSPEAMPTPVEPTPGLGAFAGTHVGEGLTEIGKELFKTGHDAYQLAIEASAQDSETAFQNKAGKILDEYKQKFGWSAIHGHQQVLQALQEAREEILGSILNKRGQLLYNNATLRIARYAQEAADRHFETQNKAYQFGAYKEKQLADVRDIRAYSDDPAKVEETLGRMEKRAREQYGKLSGDPEAIEAEVGRVRMVGATEAVRNNPALLEKYGALVPERVGEAARKELVKARVQGIKSEIFDGLPLLDARGRKDEINGFPSAVEVGKRLKVYRDDPNFDEIEAAVNKHLDQDKKLRNDQAVETAKNVRAIAQQGGKFDLDRVPFQMQQDLNALDSGLYGALLERQRGHTWADARFAEHEADRASKQSRMEAAHTLLWSKPVESKQGYTKDQFNADLDQQYTRLPVHERAILDKEYDKWSKTPHDSFTRQALEVVHREVIARWTTPDERARHEAALGEWARVNIENGGLTKSTESFIKALKQQIAGAWVEVRHSPKKPETPLVFPSNAIHLEDAPDGSVRVKH